MGPHARTDARPGQPWRSSGWIIRVDQPGSRRHTFPYDVEVVHTEPSATRTLPSLLRFSIRSVAERMAISVKTVESQVATIFSKLGLEHDPDDNRRVLAVLAFLEGRA